MRDILLARHGPSGTVSSDSSTRGTMIRANHGIQRAPLRVTADANRSSPPRLRSDMPTRHIAAEPRRLPPSCKAFSKLSKISCRSLRRVVAKNHIFRPTTGLAVRYSKHPGPSGGSVRSEVRSLCQRCAVFAKSSSGRHDVEVGRPPIPWPTHRPPTLPYGRRLLPLAPISKIFAIS